MDATGKATKLATTVSRTANLFYVKDVGFVEARLLRKDDRLACSSGDIGVILDVDIEICEEAVVVYNFEGEEYHTYHVGDVGVSETLKKFNILKLDHFTNKVLDNKPKYSPNVEKRYDKHFSKVDELAPNGPKLDENTWHHHQDETTMQEIDKRLHRRFTHIGGMSSDKK